MWALEHCIILFSTTYNFWPCTPPTVAKLAKALIIWTGLARLHGLTRLSETNYFHSYIGIELTRLAGLKTGGFRGKILRESLKL